MKKAMKQSTLVFLLNLISVLLLLVVLGSFWLTVQQSRTADKANEDRFVLTENATAFMTTSAYMTSEMRAYSATADKAHYDNYINERDNAKHRELSIAAMKATGVTAAEQAKIDEMMTISNQLVPIEDQAIADVAAGKLPEAVRSVLGTAYNDGITKLGQVQYEFLTMLQNRTTEQVAQAVQLTRVLEVQNFALVIIVIILQGFIYWMIRRKVIRPILAVEHEMRNIAAGTLSSEFDLLPDTSEIGMLADSILTTRNQLKLYIDDIWDKLSRISQQDLSINIDLAYIGDFFPIKVALEQIVGSLSASLRQINRTADQVSLGAGQVSGNSQELASGSTEQAVSVEQLSTTMSQLSEQIQYNADQSAMATNLANSAGMQLNASNEQLQGMLRAMNEISNASGEIGKIIKTIESIASQTNILALNAAVEAARAGVAGKGFAVVADEVRNLANKSAQASKNTSVMIENSLSTIQSGAKIAQDASNTFMIVMVDAKRAADAMGSITVSAQSQSQALIQVSQSIGQISSVIQENSSSAEESASASAELMQQADDLRSLVRQFRLKDAPKEAVVAKGAGDAKDAEKKITAF